MADLIQVLEHCPSCPVEFAPDFASESRRTRLEAWTLERDQLKSWMDEGDMLDKAIKTADAQISKHKKAKT